MFISHCYVGSSTHDGVRDMWERQAVENAAQRNVTTTIHDHAQTDPCDGMCMVVRPSSIVGQLAML